MGRSELLCFSDKKGSLWHTAFGLIFKIVTVNLVGLVQFRFTCFALHVSLYISSLGGPQISKIILTKLQFCVFVCQVAWYWRFIQGFWITEASNDRFIFTF